MALATSVLSAVGIKHLIAHGSEKERAEATLLPNA